MMMVGNASEPGSGRHRPLISEFLVPLAAGGAVIVVGGILAAAGDWSAGGLWAIAAAGAAVAVVTLGVGVARNAPRIERDTAPPERDLLVGVATAANERGSPGTLHPKRVFEISGHSGVGKSQIAHAVLADHPDWAFASCGELVKREAKRQGIPMDLLHTHALGQRLVESWGGSRFLDEVLAHARVPVDAETLVVDDVYHLAVAEALQGRWGHLRFAFVDLPDAMRERVIASRGVPGDQVKDVERSPLDRAAEELLRAIRCDRGRRERGRSPSARLRTRAGACRGGLKPSGRRTRRSTAQQTSRTSAARCSCEDVRGRVVLELSSEYDGLPRRCRIAEFRRGAPPPAWRQHGRSVTQCHLKHRYAPRLLGEFRHRRSAESHSTLRRL
jgi:predicted metal-binding protein